MCTRNGITAAPLEHQICHRFMFNIGDPLILCVHEMAKSIPAKMKRAISRNPHNGFVVLPFVTFSSLKTTPSFLLAFLFYSFVRLQFFVEFIKNAQLSHSLFSPLTDRVSEIQSSDCMLFRDMQMMLIEHHYCC